jgi:hypothetical protein
MRHTTAPSALAAVWSTPDHPFTWVGTLAIMVIVIGALVVLCGVLTTLTLLRSAKSSTGRVGVRPALTVGGVIAVVGALIAAGGLWLH